MYKNYQKTYKIKHFSDVRCLIWNKVFVVISSLKMNSWKLMKSNHKKEFDKFIFVWSTVVAPPKFILQAFTFI